MAYGAGGRIYRERVLGIMCSDNIKFESGMRYAIRSVKYFCVICVLLVILCRIVLWINPIENITYSEYLKHMVMHQSIYIYILLGLVVLSYPLFGFMSVRTEAFIEEDKDIIVQAFEKVGYELVCEQDGELVFRASSQVKRLMMVYEDEIVVRQYGQWIEMKGIRRIVAQVNYYMNLFLERKRMGI